MSRPAPTSRPAPRGWHGRPRSGGHAAADPMATRAWPCHPARVRAAVLLEVVLALAIFVGMAMTVLVGLSTSVRSARYLGLQTRAADLAVTCFSNLELGLLPAEDAGPEAYEDETLEDWTWQVAVQPVASELPDLDLTSVEVTICHTPSGYTYTLCRLLTTAAETSVEEGL